MTFYSIHQYDVYIHVYSFRLFLHLCTDVFEQVKYFKTLLWPFNVLWLGWGGIACRAMDSDTLLVNFR